MKRQYYEAMMMMALAMGAYKNSSLYIPEEKAYELLTEHDKLALMQRMKDKYKDIQLKKGLKEFTIDGITVLALNEKNAKRKVKKYLEM